MGRLHAALDWRYDYAHSLPLAEAVAIPMLTDMAHNWNEPFAGFSFTKSRCHPHHGCGEEHIGRLRNE